MVLPPTGFDPCTGRFLLLFEASGHSRPAMCRGRPLGAYCCAVAGGITNRCPNYHVSTLSSIKVASTTAETVPQAPQRGMKAQLARMFTPIPMAEATNTLFS